MQPSLRLRVAAWRDRLVARWRPSAPGRPVGPYRVPAPPPRAVRAPGRTALAAVRSVWTAQRCSWVLYAVGVGVVCSGALALLLRCVRFAAPRVSTPVTHVLAVPFGIFVGLVAGLLFLAFGGAALALGAMVLTSAAHAVVGCARTAYHLLVVLPRELLWGESER
jgi:hypothetical protein